MYCTAGQFDDRENVWQNYPFQAFGKKVAYEYRSVKMLLICT